jgi:hypothetical protein
MLGKCEHSGSKNRDPENDFQKAVLLFPRKWLKKSSLNEPACVASSGRKLYVY